MKRLHSRISRALWLGAALTFAGCQKAPELRGKIAGLKKLADEAEQNGALLCAPRELSLARAHLEFAEMALERGELRRAEQEFAQADLNTKSAGALSPTTECSPQADRDGDGFPDESDTCPEQPEAWNGFRDDDGCPDDPDTDGDGIPDSTDACVLEAEDFDQYLDGDGCPDPDNDLDGVLDGADKCPLDAEDPDGFEDQDGCPDPDNDRDEVPDVSDQCPNTPGQKEREPLGCPTQPALVIVTDCEVKITQQIHFATNKDIIKVESYPILDAVVDVLEKNASFKIEVQGHTDDKGSDAYNQELSSRRAHSVRKYLVSRGIAPDRLAAHGYGESRPIVPNDSDANRSLNRRVQFLRAEGYKEACGPHGQDTPDPVKP